VLVEKLAPFGRWVARTAGIACVAAGAWMLLSPRINAAAVEVMASSTVTRQLENESIEVLRLHCVRAPRGGALESVRQDGRRQGELNGHQAASSAEEVMQE